MPADGWLVAGRVDVDQSSLNGESEPVHKAPSKELMFANVENEDIDYIQGVKNANTASTAVDPNLENYLHPHRVFRGTVVVDGAALLEPCYLTDCI